MAAAAIADWRLRALGAAVFAFAITQDPLYTANQNTKYLHGAAAAGYGSLEHDWMGGTADPLPVFSALVEAMFRWNVPQASYAIFAVLAGIFAWSLTSTVTAARLIDTSRARVLAFASGLVLTQAVLAKWPNGLAEQYMLEHYLQPSVFGVLLIAGIAAYLRQRTVPAAGLVAAAAWIHPDYLPAAIVCLLVFATVRSDRRGFDRRQFAVVAVFSVLALAPLGLHLRGLLRPTTPELWQQSLDVLVRYRIPHHAEVTRWIDADDVRRLCVMALGTWLARGRGLKHLMVALLALIVGTLLAAEFFELEALEAVTPWRASVLLMPLALAVILARAVSSALGRWPRREPAFRRAAWLLFVLAIGVGAWRQVDRVRAYDASPPMAAMRWIRANDGGIQTFVVPTRDVRFDRFRLVTGQPIVINWKTHPYRDVELLEWRRRVEAVDALYDARSASEACDVLERLVAAYDVSRAVVEETHPLATGTCPAVTIAFRAEGFAVARIGTGARGTG
jgi:hypothetical protein